MKTKYLGVLTVTGLLAAASASASLITTYNNNISQTVPDGNPVGITSTINVSGLGNILSSGDNVTMTLNISGGNNGDLYAFLSYDGHIVTLLNRPGVVTLGNPVGYMGAGYNVTLSDGSSYNINTDSETIGAQVTGTFNPAGGSTAFQSYNGMNPNGGWVLFISDLSGGDPSQSVLHSWSLTLDVVPEPVNVALGVFGMLFAVIVVVSRRAKRCRMGHPQLFAGCE
jgi:hypothetical protein